MSQEYMTFSAPVRRYQAQDKRGNKTIWLESPRAAAVEFFARFPGSRKCDVQQWHLEGGRYIRRCIITDKSTWMRDFPGVTKSVAETLPTEG